MLKPHGVLLKGMAKKISWWEPAEAVGVTGRTMPLWREHSGRCAPHPRERERRPSAGMLLNIDGSKHRYFQDGLV